MLSFELKDYKNSNHTNNSSSKKIEIDGGVSVFLLIDGSDEASTSPILDKIIDIIIENITKKDIYDKFSVCLGLINNYLENIGKNGDISIFIGVLDQNDLYFSKVGKIEGIMINQKGNLMPLFSKGETPDKFDYIANGKIQKGEVIVMSTKDLNEYLSGSDWDDLSLLYNIESIVKNILDILTLEDVDKSISILGIYNNELLEGKSKKQKTPVIKNSKMVLGVIAFFKKIKTILESQGRVVKNLVFFLGIIISITILYTIISGVVDKGVESSKVNDYKQNLVDARNYLKLADQNIDNNTEFEKNIENAEKLLDEVEANNLFINDVENIRGDIELIKKQFNGIETFKYNSDNLIFKGDFNDAIKLLSLNKKMYVISKDRVFGSLLPGQDIVKHTFNDLEVGDSFIDATTIQNDILILTKNHKVVRFNTQSKFSYVSITNDEQWVQGNIIKGYGNNIYITNNASDQFFRYKTVNQNFGQGDPYLDSKDIATIGKIQSIAIDGGIYILSSEGKAYKYISTKNELVTLLINRLPKNYAITDDSIIYRDTNLNYVYMYIDGAIWVFKTDSKSWQDTRSITYLGQIDGEDDILGFEVSNDGEINILIKSGIYSVKFEVRDDKIMLK